MDRDTHSPLPPPIKSNTKPKSGKYVPPHKRESGISPHLMTSLPTVTHHRTDNFYKSRSPQPYPSQDRTNTRFNKHFDNSYNQNQRHGRFTPNYYQRTQESNRSMFEHQRQSFHSGIITQENCEQMMNRNRNKPPTHSNPITNSYNSSQDFRCSSTINKQYEQQNTDTYDDGHTQEIKEEEDIIYEANVCGTEIADEEEYFVENEAISKQNQPKNEKWLKIKNTEKKDSILKEFSNLERKQVLQQQIIHGDQKSLKELKVSLHIKNEKSEEMENKSDKNTPVKEKKINIRETLQEKWLLKKAEFLSNHPNKYHTPHEINKIKDAFMRLEMSTYYTNKLAEKKKTQNTSIANTNDNSSEVNERHLVEDENGNEIDPISGKIHFHATSEFTFFREFYEISSPIYIKWREQRRTAWANKHMSTFFGLKFEHETKSNRSSPRNIMHLFRRFYRYAIDIEIGCGYLRDIHSQAILKKARGLNTGTTHVYFMDIGFAPGGMSRLLLDADQDVCGVGLTLPPFEAGNAYINELVHNERFIVHECDVVIFARKVKTRVDFLKLSNMCTRSKFGMDFGGFQLIIVGITIHQSFAESNFRRLDHQILLSELYLAFLTLSNGGSILIRHKLALDLIHQHILFSFLKCFQSFEVAKPLTEFSIRKTFWVLWKGFDKNCCRKIKLVQNLRKLINTPVEEPPYARNRMTRKYWGPFMVEDTCVEIIAQKKEGFLAVMNPMFEIQFRSIKDFCDGKKDRLCLKGESCYDYRKKLRMMMDKRETVVDADGNDSPKKSESNFNNSGGCNRAHIKEQCITGLWEALLNVDNMMLDEIARNKSHSHILAQMENHHRNHSLNKNRDRRNVNRNMNWNNINRNVTVVDVVDNEVDGTVGFEADTAVFEGRTGTQDIRQLMSR